MLIGLSLTALLLTFLFSFLVSSVKVEEKLDRARKEILARGELQTRLQDVLSSISSGSLYTQQNQQELSPNLIAVFDNGIDPDPAFAGPVLTRIFLDENRDFCLAIRPLDNNNKAWRKEILLPAVTKFEFRFLSSLSAKIEKEQIYPINAAYCWRTAWSKQRSEIPSLIRLILEKEGETIEFAFILPSVDPFVTYSTKKTI